MTPRFFDGGALGNDTVIKFSVLKVTTLARRTNINSSVLSVFRSRKFDDIQSVIAYRHPSRFSSCG